MRRKRGLRNIDQKVFEGYFPKAYIGVITPEEVKALIGTLRITVEQLMTELLSIAKQRAQIPISGFPVGAVCRGDTGTMYLGANFEFIGGTLQNTIHAEQVAITYAMLHGETGIKALTVSTTPCGHCRQFINEIANADEITVHIQGKEQLLFKDLLPRSFGPQDLSKNMFMLDQKTQAINFPTNTQEEVITKAVEAAGRSYSPYSQCFAGAAIETVEGKFYSGAYIENAAYNPSILPIQAAIINLIMSGRRYNQIKKIAIVQSGNSKLNLTESSVTLANSLTSSPVKTLILE